MSRILWAIGRDNDGATAIEYGLIVSLVCVVAVVGLEAVGGSLSGMLDLVASTVANVVAGVSNR